MADRVHDWDDLAKRYIEAEKMMPENPPSLPILLCWKTQSYIASIYVPFPDYTREIVLLRKSPQPINTELAKALKKFDKGRLELTADYGLDLTEKQYVLRRVGTRLTKMTQEQAEYTTANLPQL